MYQRGFRGGRRRNTRSLGTVVQSYKKVQNSAIASFSPGFQSEFLVQGVDHFTGQLTAVDANAPTGSIIKYIEIQFACANLVETACFVNCTVQYTLDGQTVIDPDQVGGNARRNQVLHQDMFSVGGFQNSTHKFRFKVPKKFQRVREGMDWVLVWSNSATVSRNVQTIYKFYR